MRKPHRNPRPVDRTSARVLYGRPEHYQPPLWDEVGHKTYTWRYPPEVQGVMPEGETDWTGVRYGRLTAAYWYRPEDKGACWIVRCDCGNYEVRRPAIWDREISSRWRGNDACRVCRAQDVALGRVPPSSKKSTTERRNRWIASMMARGFTVEEVAEIMVRNDIHVTASTTPEEARNLLRLKRTADQPPTTDQATVGQSTLQRAIAWIRQAIGGAA